MSPDLERSLRDVVRRFPRPDRTTTAETLSDLRATFARDRRRRRLRTPAALVAVAVGAGVFGAVGWALAFRSTAPDALPRPVMGPGTFVCPRFVPEFTVEIGSVSGGIYGQASTKGAPVERGGSIVYGQAGPTTAAVDPLCRRSSRTSVGRAEGFNDVFTQILQQSSYADYEDVTCTVRGRVFVRIVPLRAGGARVGTRLDIGAGVQRNLVARIDVRKREATMQTSPHCR